MNRKGIALAALLSLLFAAWAPAQIRAVKSADEYVCGFRGATASDMTRDFVCLRDSMYVLRIYLDHSAYESSAWDEGVFVELPLGHDADECVASVDALSAMFDDEGRTSYTVGTAGGGECAASVMPAKVAGMVLRISQGDGSARFTEVTRSELRRLRRNLSAALGQPK